MKTFKWGILAPGNIANNFAKGLAVIPDAVPWAVGSRDLGRARVFAEKYGFQKAYGSYDELAHDKDVDAIYVATPHPFHEEAVLTCLRQGKPVLCEKPFAANAAQAARMIAEARKQGVFLMEAMWTRFLPAVRKMMALVADGAIGRVRHITADFGFRADVNPASRLFDPALAGGSLLDVGVYNLSFCSMVYGKQPDRVQSHMVIGSTGVDEATTVQLSYRDGSSASLFTSVRLNTLHEAVLYGDAGHIRMPIYWRGDTVILNNGDGQQAFNLPFKASGFQFETMEVMACLEKGLTESPLMPLDETLSVAKTMDAIRFDNHLRYPFEEEICL